MSRGITQRQIENTLQLVNRALGTDYNIYFGKTYRVWDEEAKKSKERTTSTKITNGRWQMDDPTVVFKGSQYLAEKWVNEKFNSAPVQAWVESEKIRRLRNRLESARSEVADLERQLFDLTGEEA